MKNFAIYDIDYTVISVNSLLWFYFYLFLKKPIKLFYFPYLCFVTVLWVCKIISTKKVKELWLFPIAGFKKDYLDSFCKDFIQEFVLPKIKPEAAELIKKQKESGYIIIFASASFEFYIKFIADFLNADYCIGTKVLFDNDKLLPKLDGNNCRGNEKINRIIKKYPMDEFNKEESFSYSDSLSDLPFLKLSNTFYKMHLAKWKILKTIKN